MERCAAIYGDAFEVSAELDGEIATDCKSMNHRSSPPVSHVDVDPKRHEPVQQRQWGGDCRMERRLPIIIAQVTDHNAAVEQRLNDVGAPPDHGVEAAPTDSRQGRAGLEQHDNNLYVVVPQRNAKWRITRRIGQFKIGPLSMSEQRAKRVGATLPSSRMASGLASVVYFVNSRAVLQQKFDCRHVSFLCCTDEQWSVPPETGTKPTHFSVLNIKNRNVNVRKKISIHIHIHIHF